MLNIHETIMKAQQENSNISIMFKVPVDQPAAKITIEKPGEDTVVINNAQEFVVFAKSDPKFYCIGVNSLGFLLVIFKLVKEKIDDALGNGFTTKP